MSAFPKSRVDALTDGIFAIAMTLLVLDVRVPADLPISSAQDLTAHLRSLLPQVVTYLISFFVLGAFWRGSIAARPTDACLDGAAVRLWLLFLFFVTTVPFSSSVVGQYGAYAPAVFVYAANMIALGLLSIAARHLDLPRDQRSLAAAAGAHMPLFIASAVASLLIALVAPHVAMYAYCLNILSRLPFWPAGRSTS